MTAATRLDAAVAIATVLASCGLLPLTEDRAYLVLLGAMLLASVLVGAIARSLRAPDALARILRLLPGLAAIWWLWELWPTLIPETTGYVAVAYAPMEPHEGFRVLSVGVLWLLFVIAEAIAGGLDRPGWTFPVLVLPYLVPAIVLSEETSPLYLVPACAGYLLILATAVYNRTSPGLTGGRRRLAGGIALTGALAGIAAWTLSGVAATAIPERGFAFLDPSRTDTSVQLGDPTLDLIRNLRAPSSRRIIDYTSSDGRGHYLRLVALPALDRNGFHLVPTDLMPGLPEDPAAGPGPTVHLEVEVDDFGSEWLPVPWVPRSFEAEGEWRHDPATGAIVAVGANRALATRFLEYAVDARLLQPDRETIADAAAGDPGDAGLSLELPDDLDPEVVALAERVTADTTTAGERTLALLAWLHSDEFTYSTAIVDGSTMETVSDFLLSSRTGYCEQFAGSLAIMARAVSVPSRVVVGFLPGVATDQGYEISTKDMHAWTEIFLDGLGWVAFDPTPSGAPGAAPEPSPSPTPTTTSPSADPEDDVPSPSATPTTSPSGAGTGFRFSGWMAAAAALLALVLLPTGLRRFRTWRRMHPGGEPAGAAEDLWDELRDTALDLGLAWPQGTPRQVAAELADGLDPVAAQAVVELGIQVERARFAPEVDRSIDPLLLHRVTTALAATAPDSRGLGRLFPRSVFRQVR